MVSPYLFSAFAAGGKAAASSYDRQIEINDRKAKEAKEESWTDEVRGRQRDQWIRDDQIRTEIGAAAEPGSIEEFDEPIQSDAGQEAEPRRRFRIKGTDQVFDDRAAADSALKLYNSQAQQQMRAADRVSKIDFQKGLALRQSAVATQQAETSLDEATQKQIINTANRVLTSAIPYSPKWQDSLVGHINNMAGRPIAQAVPTKDGAGFTLLVKNQEGKVINGGTYGNDEAGWSKYMSSALQRSPAELLQHLDAFRRYQMQVDERRAQAEDRERVTQENIILRDALRDDGRAGSSGGGSGRKSGSAGGDSYAGGANAAVNAAIDAIVEASKNADGAMKLSADQLNDARANATRVINSNPGIDPNIAASVAMKITMAPDSVKPRLDAETGKIHGVFTDPNTGDKFKAYDFPQGRLTAEDRQAIKSDVKSMQAEDRAQDPRLASLIESSAFSAGRPTPELVDYLVQQNMRATKDLLVKQGKRVPSDIELNRIATQFVNTQALPIVGSKIEAIRQYGDKPKVQAGGERARPNVTVNPGLIGSPRERSAIVEPQGRVEFGQAQNAAQMGYVPVGRGNSMFGAGEILYENKETGDRKFASQLFKN